MADIGSYILAGSQGLAGGLDKIAAQMRISQEQQDAEARTRAFLSASPGMFGGQPSTLGSLAQPQPVTSQNPGNASTSPLSGAANAISGIESGGRYDAMGPQTRTGDRAHGKYQVMGANVGPWTEKYLGRAMTPQEFLANPQAQEAVFQGEFGRLSQKYGPEGAARAWFAGEGGMNDPNRKDVLGTSVAQYGSKFSNAFNGAPSGQQQANPLAAMGPMPSQAQTTTLAQLAAPQQPQFDVQTLAALMGNRQTSPIAQAVLAKQLGRDPIEQQMNMIRLTQAQNDLNNSPEKTRLAFEAAQLANRKAQMEINGEGNKITYQDLGDSIGVMNSRGDLVKTIPKSQKPVALGEGQQLVNPVTGAVVAGGDQKPKLTEAQSKDLSFYQRGVRAENTLAENEASLADRGKALQSDPVSWFPGISKDASESFGRMVGPKDYQSALQASRDVVSVLLRKDSGAAITKDEWDYARRVWLPVPGDSTEIIAQKRASRQEALNSLKLGLGKADSLATARIGQPAGTQPVKPLDIGKSTEIDGVKIQRIR